LKTYLPVARVVMQRSHYIPGIDGLRALAVLSVVAFHLRSSITPGGFTGVDIFFVISGYVVSGSLVRSEAIGFWRFALEFYRRRIFRIYPALVVCLVFSAVLQSLLIPASWLSSTSSKTAIYAFFGLSNFALVWFNDGYFSPRVEFNSFTHTWSLGVEEQYYLIFPVLVYFWMRSRDHGRLRRLTADWLLPVLVLLSFAWSAVETRQAPQHAYYLLPSRLWELGLGALLNRSHLQSKLLATTRSSVTICIALGLLVLATGFLWSKPIHFPFPYALLPVAGSLLVIAGLAGVPLEGRSVADILTNRVGRYIGQQSYSLYLWHWPVLVLFRWTVGLETVVNSFLALMLIGCLSLLSYYVVERPSRRGVLRRLSPKLAFGIGVALLSCSLLLTKIIFWLQPEVTLSVTRDRGMWYPDVPSSMLRQQPVDKQDLRGRTLFVIGDSHAQAYSAMLEKLSVEHGVNIRLFARAACPVVALVRVPAAECSAFTENSISEIRRDAKPGDVVFLASLRMDRLGDEWKVFDRHDLDDSHVEGALRRPAVAYAEAESVLATLDKLPVSIVIDAPMPVFRSPPFRCADFYDAGNPICDGGFQVNRAETLKRRTAVMEGIVALEHDHPRMHVWDPLPILCPREVCDAFEGKKPLFFDGDHLSGYGNLVLYPSFLDLMKSIWT
jgi:peptidoglycan/LPS O-acetylase OafA/YrhL